jgi:DNA-binding response OmpR family regulator
VAREDKLLTVLHVEDEDNDALLLVKACEQAHLPVIICRTVDAETAKAYLQGQGEFADRSKHPLPHLIILDLKLPGINGFEFLSWLRAENLFASLPVLVFTASLMKEDRVRAEEAGANSFFVKPTSFDAWVKMVENIKIPGQDK